MSRVTNTVTVVFRDVTEDAEFETAVETIIFEGDWLHVTLAEPDRTWSFPANNVREVIWDPALGGDSA